MSTGFDILYFKGELEFDNISELILEVKEKSPEFNISHSVYKKILTLMIESLENVIRYRKFSRCDKKLLMENPTEFKIYSLNNKYIIESRNTICNEDISELENKVKYLNGLDKKALRDLYKTTIVKGKYTEKGGAGLGFIEMARLTENNMIYSFTKINNKNSWFILKLEIA